MVRYALLARVEAKAGREGDVEQLLVGAQPLAQAERGTRTWYAWRTGQTTFGIFDTFDDQVGREAHLSGEIAQALMESVELFANPPVIEKLDVIAAK